ncbi:MAG: DUF4397 domain-containing protein, partial [Chloroflexota bacterium]|nr:DUF4397 domain-containing protein [Chloroflexota bacterium]
VQPIEAQANLYVIHGINGSDLSLDPALPVDVLVNDSICLLEGLTFQEVVGPVALDPGTYNIKIGLANSDNPCSNDPVIEADIELYPWENATVIAHLNQDGTPTASKYTNDLSAVCTGMTRVTARHTAAAPTVDAKLQRGWWWWKRVITLENLSNSHEASAIVKSTFWNISIMPDCSRQPILGPSGLHLKNCGNYFIYVVGSSGNCSLGTIIHQI